MDLDKAIADLEAQQGVVQQTGITGIPEVATTAPPEKTVMEEYAPVIGSLLGGVGATVYAKNPSLLMQAGRSALGTGLGASIGTSASQISRQLGGEDISLPSIMKEQVGNVGTQVAADVAGSALGAGLIKGYRAIKPLAEPDPIIRRAQEELLKRDSTLSLGQAKPRTLASVLEGATRQTLTGKLTFERLHQSQDAALKAMREDLTPLIDNMSISRVGENVKDAIHGGYSALSDMVKPMYEDISLRAAAKGVFVDTIPVQKEAQAVLKQQERIGNVGLTEQGGTVLKRLVQGDNTLSFSDAQQLRSDLLSRGRMLEDGDPAKKNITTLISTLTSQMEQGAKLAGSDVYNDLMKLNSFYRKSQTKLGDEFVSKVVEKSPGHIVDTIITPGNEKEISMLKVALKRAEGLGGPKYDDIWSGVQQHYINNMLSRRGVVSKEGETIGENLLKDFTDPSTKRTMDRVLSKEQINALKSFAETSFVTQNKPQAQNSVLIPMVQAGALMDLISFRFMNPAASTSIILGPSAISKWLTNPERSSRALQILKNPTAPFSPNFMAKVTADAQWAHKEEQKDVVKQSAESELEQLYRSMKQ